MSLTNTLFHPLIYVLQQINLLVEYVLKPIVTLLMALMLATVVFAVFSRTTGIIAPWTEKVMLVLLPCLAFLVAPIAYRRAANVSLNFFQEMLPSSLQKLHQLLIHLLIGVILFIALDLSLRKIGINPQLLTELIDFVFGIDLSAIRPFKARIKIPILGIELKTVYTTIPICVFLMISVNFEMILRSFLKDHERNFTLTDLRNHKNNQ